MRDLEKDNLILQMLCIQYIHGVSIDDVLAFLEDDGVLYEVFPLKPDEDVS